MKKRPLVRIPMGEGLVLYRVTIEGTKATYTDKESQRQQFISTLFANSTILDCGQHGFDTLKIFYEEEGWVAVSEAMVNE